MAESMGFECTEEGVDGDAGLKEAPVVLRIELTPGDKFKRPMVLTNEAVFLHVPDRNWPFTGIFPDEALHLVDLDYSARGERVVYASSPIREVVPFVVIECLSEEDTDPGDAAAPFFDECALATLKARFESFSREPFALKGLAHELGAAVDNIPWECDVEPREDALGLLFARYRLLLYLWGLADALSEKFSNGADFLSPLQACEERLVLFRQQFHEFLWSRSPDDPVLRCFSMRNGYMGWKTDWVCAAVRLRSRVWRFLN